MFSGFIQEIRNGIHGASPDLLCVAFEEPRFFEDVEAVLEADPDVVATAPRLRHYGLLYAHGRVTEKIQGTPGLVTGSYDFVELLGVDPVREQAVTGMERWLTGAAWEGLDPAFRGEDLLQVPPELIESANAPGTGPENIRIGTANGLLLSTGRVHEASYRRGQYISVLSGSIDVVGDKSKFTNARAYLALAGAYQTRHPALDSTTAFMELEPLGDMMGLTFNDPLMSEVAVRCRDGADLDTVARRLEPLIGATVLTWEEQNATYLGAVDRERGLMKLTLFAVLLVAAFLIYATLHMMVTQKTREIGVLGAMGATPTGILQVFVGTGAVLGVVGCALGAFLGVLSAHYLNDVNDWFERNFEISLFPKALFALDKVPYVVEPSWVLQVVAGALFITLLAAFLPARRAARLTPVRALSHE
ncbi:MAG: FtsX-like permease family protein [Planctomycetota bacterium]